MHKGFAAAVVSLILTVGFISPYSHASTLIRVGNQALSSDAGIFIALDKGYFKEQGLEISLERFGGGTAEEIPLLATGRLEVGAGTPGATLFNAIVRGIPIVAVADKGSIRKGFGFNVLVVRKALVDSGQFKQLSDLKGRVIASAGVASLVNFEIFLTLKRAGLTVKDVTIEYIELPDQIAAMANGKIDAAVMVEPLATAAELRGIGQIVMPMDRLLPDFQIALIYFSGQWAHEHPDDARRWMIAYVKGLRYYNQAFKDPKVRDDVILILSAHTPIKDRAVYDKMIWPGLHPDGTVDTRTLLDYERWLVNERQVSQFLPPARFVDLSFAQYAARTLGPSPP